jgi:hypothetical protein
MALGESAHVIGAHVFDVSFVNFAISYQSRFYEFA